MVCFSRESMTQPSCSTEIGPWVMVVSEIRNSFMVWGGPAGSGAFNSDLSHLNMFASRSFDCALVNCAALPRPNSFHATKLRAGKMICREQFAAIVEAKPFLRIPVFQVQF